MSFIQRLAYYLLGLMIGGFIVFYFWDAKDSQFCYLPNCRVLKDIRSKSFVIADEAKEEASHYTTEDFKKFFTDGDVDFSQSNVPEDGGKKYLIETVDANNQPITITIINYQDRAVLKSITKQ